MQQPVPYWPEALRGLPYMLHGLFGFIMSQVDLSFSGPLATAIEEGRYIRIVKGI